MAVPSVNTPEKVALIYDSLAYLHSNMIQEVKKIFFLQAFVDLMIHFGIHPFYYLAPESKLEAEVNILWSHCLLAPLCINAKYLQLSQGK